MKNENSLEDIQDILRTYHRYVDSNEGGTKQQHVPLVGR